MGVRNASEGGLESDNPAARGRKTEGASAISPERERPLSRRDRCCGATGRATGGARKIPWIPGDTEQRAVGERFVAELRGGRFPDEDRAGLAQPANGHSVLR